MLQSQNHAKEIRINNLGDYFPKALLSHLPDHICDADIQLHALTIINDLAYHFRISPIEARQFIDESTFAQIVNALQDAQADSGNLPLSLLALIFCDITMKKI